ncbi:MAG TPA: pyridoxal-dependent decarboxylase [Brevundimonas sp.]|uniref:pyridoxal phosphate-dependent decarboxylase family protein n=1 Tax=Brevundimonas sp. TaxID=1871086 RepID=UPI00260AC1B8|nr:pyridoxal-dependent decarboxylase [Brevundimonas sp.]HRO32079.1 pyridoxal-dependent decarboxylase [Brevundimonas sp.]
MTASPAAPSPLDLAGAYFPGPHGENEAWMRTSLGHVLDAWFNWRRSLFPQDAAITTTVSPAAGAQRDKLAVELDALCRAMTSETPTCTPRYISHMKADISTPALMGWLAAMLHNPNNTSREASRVGTVIETEAIAMLARMLGYDPDAAQGHFTSGGTVANLEAVWRARHRMDLWLGLALHLAETKGRPLDVFADAHMGWGAFRRLWAAHDLSEDILRPERAAAGNPMDIWRRIDRLTPQPWRGPVLLAPGAAHYSWRKAVNIFGLGEDSLWSVALDDQGRMDLDDLDRLIQRARDEARPILMTVAVAGTTETGQIDPMDRWQARLDDLRREHGLHVWSHVDAAYGGFLRAIDLDGAAFDDRTRTALAAMGRAESLTIDPHKLGYTPYACGAFLTRDAVAYAVSTFDAPYLDRPELGDGKWSSTLEGSRSAAGAAATWLTGRTLGFCAEGLGAVLAETIAVRRAFQAAIGSRVPQARFLAPVDSNIACFCIAAEGQPLSVVNQQTLALFDDIHRSPTFSVSRTTLGATSKAAIARHVAGWNGTVDASGLVLIRCVFMTPYWAAPAARDTLFQEFADLIARQIAPGLEAAA